MVNWRVRSLSRRVADLLRDNFTCSILCFKRWPPFLYSKKRNNSAFKFTKCKVICYIRKIACMLICNLDIQVIYYQYFNVSLRKTYLYIVKSCSSSLLLAIMRFSVLPMVSVSTTRICFLLKNPLSRDVL